MRGAQPGPPRPPLRASPRRKRPLARTLRVRQHHGVTAAPVRAHARRGRNGGKLNAPLPNVARPSALRPPPRRGNTRSPGHVSPSACAARRRPTTPTSTPRCVGFPLAVTSTSPGILAPPLAMSHPWALSTRCHPPTCTGTRSGTFPACRTQ
jgi:hypothetical protein